MFSFQVIALGARKASRLNHWQLLKCYRSSILTVRLLSSFNLEIIFLYVQTTMLQKTIVCMWLLLTNKSYSLSISSSVRRIVLNHQLSPCFLRHHLQMYLSSRTISPTTNHSIRPQRQSRWRHVKLQRVHRPTPMTTTGLEIAFERPSSPTLASGKTGGSRAVQLAPQVLVSWLQLLLLAHTTRMNVSSRRLTTPKWFSSLFFSPLSFFL